MKQKIDFEKIEHINLCKKDCGNCSKFTRCGGCSLCEAAICDRKCRICGTVCMRRGQSVLYANKILKEQVKLVINTEVEIPAHIPVLPDRLKTKLEYEVSPMIAVHGGVALKKSGDGVRKIYKVNGFRKTLNIDERCEGVLQFYVKDGTLEGIWDSRKDLYDDIKKLGFKIVIAPNFSVYEDTPRLEHLYNIQRSLIIYNELIQHGINAVPDIAWYNKNDLDYWIDEINTSGCKIIAYSFQVVDVRLKASNIWKHYLGAFRYLCNKISVDTIIVIGVNSEARMKEIRRAVPKKIKLSVLNQSAYIQSQRGMYSKGRESDKKTDKDILLKKNIMYFNKIYDDLNSGEEENSI